MDNTGYTVEDFAFQLDEFYLDLQQDGSRISILEKEKIAKRPFPGLRPFKTSEFQLFKGRDGQAEELIKRLKQHHFLAVIGSSGTGKSSLVRAGLIPQLFGGYLHEAGNKWNIAICRPGKNPVENLSIALSSVKGHCKNKDHIYKNYQMIEPLLSNSIYGILDADELLNSNLANNEHPNLLIIIDQFEELFRFDRKDLGKENIENHFVNLLLKSALNPQGSVYVIITMRSEFLGDCVKYRNLPEAINQGQYLVPQLSRNQLRDVIEGPVNLAGKKISPDLVELLINEIESEKLKENLDQLPILQHALMRTYQEAMSEGTETEINYEHYNRTGEMELALANHAEIKYKELANGKHDENNASKKQLIAKMIFQALTDSGNDKKGGRRPTELKHIYAIAQSLQATEAEVNEVVDHFRDIETSFIMPPVNTPLYPNLMLDISHESLMRNWEKLTGWIEEEVHLGKLYKKLLERREYNNEHDKDDFIRGALLRDLVDWRDQYPKNSAWAGRYHQENNIVCTDLLNGQIYQNNLNFLAASQSKSQAAKDAEKKKLQAEIEMAQKDRARKKIIRVFAAASIISICFGFWAFSESNRAEEQGKLAIASADSARIQRSIAEQKASEAGKQSKRADSSAHIASIQKLIAEQTAMEANQQRQRAEKYAQEIKKQNELAIRLKTEAEANNEESRKQLVKNTLQKEKFYSSNILELTTRDAIINALFLKPLNKTTEIPIVEYVDTSLLNSVDMAVAAREQMLDSPVQGLRKAANLWSKKKDKYTRNILAPLFANYIFYKQKIDPLFSDHFSFENASLVVSSDTSRFAYNNAGYITSGTSGNGKLSVERDRYSTYTGYASRADILALTYGENDAILAFHEDGKIMERSKKGVKQIDSFSYINGTSVILAAFSPDGKSLLIAFRNGSIKMWSVKALKRKEKDNLLFNDSSAINRYITQVTFSPDGKRMIKLFSTGKMEIWNLSANRPVLVKTDIMAFAANFSPDGNYILTNSSGNFINVLDTTGKFKNGLQLAAPADYSRQDYFNYRIDQLNLSPDRRRLLVVQNGKIFLYQAPAGDSIISTEKTRHTTSYLTSRTFLGSQDAIKKLSFLKSDQVVTLNNNEQVQLWDTDKKFTNLDAAFASVEKITRLTLEEKLQLEQIDFREVLSYGKDDLSTAASFYYNRPGGAYEDDGRRRDDLRKAKILYEKIATVTEDKAENMYAINKINAIDDKLIAVEFDKNQDHPNYQEIVKLYKEKADNGEYLLKSDTTDTNQRKNLSLIYWNLSWYLLFDKNFDKAITAALASLRHWPAYEGVNTNLALGYLLNKDKKLFDEALLVYKKFKQKTYTDASGGEHFFAKAFLQDFKDLQDAGIITAGDSRVNAIKDFLNNNKLTD